MSATRYDDAAAHEAWIAHLAGREPLPPGMDARIRAALRAAAPSAATRTTRAGGSASGVRGLPTGPQPRPGSLTGAGGAASTPVPARSSPAAVPAPKPQPGAGPAPTPARAADGQRGPAAVGRLGAAAPRPAPGPTAEREPPFNPFPHRGNPGCLSQVVLGAVALAAFLAVCVLLAVVA